MSDEQSKKQQEQHLKSSEKPNADDNKERKQGGEKGKNKDKEQEKEKSGQLSDEKKGQGEEKEEPQKKSTNIPESIEDCESLIKKTFKNSSDVVVHIFDTVKGKAMLVYIDGLASKDLMDRDVVLPLKRDSFDGDVEKAINISQYKAVEDFGEALKEIVGGNSAIFFEDASVVSVVDLKFMDKRSVDSPDAEAVVRGPKEGFTEVIRSNTSLLRRKLRTPDLVIENLVIGKRSNTNIGIAYLHGVVNKEVLQQVKERLSHIDTDAILESGYIEQFIEDSNFSPISTMGASQKPDVIAAKILEGRVAIFCDGTPHVLTVPQLFVENMQTSEDYYNRVTFTMIIRLLRYFALFISVLLPGFFVAVITFNQEMIPTSFLLTLISASEKVPLPAAAEAFFMLLMFELLRESGTRLPKPIGSAISIVGALIIGDAAVNAGIVGAPMVIVIALTAVSSFINPNLMDFMTLYRFLFLFLGGSMGLVGIGTGLMIMFTQLISTKSFGIPILSSFSKEEMKDSIIRFPLKMMKFRPASIVKQNARRQKG